jgi:DNA-binding response OmpR family regulator
MPTILLVEDDVNIREIYSARFEAEGYTIVVSGDGEEALAAAVREKPDLIVSDIMMPKISGFDMLDILRSAPETKDVKVIMMTALGQEEDRQRGESLGADRYFVKSQVTLDEVVQAVQELLGQAPATPGQPVANDDSAAQSPSASDDLAGEVADFAASSPLMNGSAPTPRQPQTQVAPNDPNRTPDIDEIET